MLYSSGGDAVFPYSVASSSSWYKAAATNRVATLNQVPCVYIGTPNHPSLSLDRGEDLGTRTGD